MATKVTTTKTQPAVVMDKLHVDSFTLTQQRCLESSKTIGMSAVLYGIDEEGNCIFDKETIGVSDTNVDKTILMDAEANGITPVEFMGLLATAKAEVSAEIAAGTLNDAKLMAYFEAALGRILELHGKIGIDSVE